MAEFAIATVAQLDDGLILTPERYNPRRRIIATGGPTVRDYAIAVSNQVNAKTAAPTTRYLVLDTTDAREGVILTKKAPMPGSGLGSAKKLLRPGDVIISRLRPYLHQVAYIDSGLFGDEAGLEVVCSTEFYVLRSRDSESIAFLVAWLLSSPVQDALAAAQEGGHHPRFNLATLEAITVPESLAAKRKTVSTAVESATRRAREADTAMDELVRRCMRLKEQ